MWKRVFKWLLNSVDLSVNVVDGLIVVRVYFMDALVFEHEFDLAMTQNAKVASVIRKVGKYGT
jgi:hypothetical protein